MNILVTICARGGSKGIPGKNIKLLNGKPLISYSIKMALKIAEKYNADISLSTDDINIKSTASDFGLETEYQRPTKYATDTSGKVEVINDLLLYEENKRAKLYDFIIDLDVTSPLRTIEDIDKAFSQLQSIKNAYNIFSVSLANRNPYFNMVELQNDGFVRVVKPNSGFKSRQEAPVVYDMNASFYIFRKSFFNEKNQLSTTDKSLAHVMNHVCFDLDNPIDFTIMEILLKEKILPIVI
jgi:CMP-N,N'-diacetyllegionaminic acid synthase